MAWAPILRNVNNREELESFIRDYILDDMKNRASDVEHALREMSQGRIQKYRLKYILAKRTQYIEKKAWDKNGDQSLDRFLESKLEIEHILPTNPADGVREAFDKEDEYEDYMKRLGNLMLLEKTINASVRNDFYKNKSKCVSCQCFFVFFFMCFSVLEVVPMSNYFGPWS